MGALEFEEEFGSLPRRRQLGDFPPADQWNALRATLGQVPKRARDRKEANLAFQCRFARYQAQALARR